MAARPDSLFSRRAAKVGYSVQPTAPRSAPLSRTAPGRPSGRSQTAHPPMTLSSSTLVLHQPPSGRCSADRGTPAPVTAGTSSGSEGANGPVQGQRVCTSGAVTGEHCNLRTTNTNVVSRCSTAACTGFLFLNDSGGPALGIGDSGGPVYIMKSDGTVGARGIISGGANDVVACGSSAAATTCTKGGFAISITSIEDRFGVRVEQ